MCAGVARGTTALLWPLVPVGLLGLLFSPFAGVLVGLAAVVVLVFHRDPDRAVPESGLLAPADGRVSVVRQTEEDRLRVGVFMNLDDVHVNRAPLGGTVQSVTHSPGGHWPAFSKGSDRNEKVHVEFESHTVVLIAGAIARRIHPYVSPGDAVDRGQRIGHISFSSRVDIVCPPAVDRSDLVVERGDPVRAGETVLAEW